jgi:hypothetical protein
VLQDLLTINFFITEIMKYNSEDPKEKDTCEIKELIGCCDDKTYSDLYQNKKTYKQFMKFCLIHVVGLTRMTKMGENYAEKDWLSFKEVITSTDESFAILLLEDRWLLWRKRAVLRGEKIRENLPNNEPTGTDNLGGDEDDQADRDNQDRRIDGTNLTIYSMYGRLARHWKGFNVKHAMMRQNAIKQNIVKPFRTSSEGKLQMKKMRDWWGGEQKGPKRKRQRVEDDDDVNIDNEDNEYGSSDEECNSDDE